MLSYFQNIQDRLVDHALRTMVDTVNGLTYQSAKTVAAVSQIKVPTIDVIQQSLQAGGSNPINITQLPGVSGSPQVASGIGTFAARPSAGSVSAGMLYYATDQGTAYISDGSNWNTISRRFLIGGFYGIFLHANSADRTYTFPDATGNIVYETAALTLNNFLFGGGGALAKDSGFSVVPAASGGTGQSSYAIGDLLYASGATALSKLSDAATGNALLSGGAGVAPAYGKVDLTATVTGVLPIANGGTGVNYNRISDTIALVNQAADISTTAFANSSTVGTYRASYYLVDTTSDITAGAVTLTIAFTDSAGATTVASSPVALTGSGTLRTSGVFFIQLASGNITYAVSHTGLFGTAKYALYISLERLS